MKHLVEFPLQEGGTILVEVDGAGHGTLEGSRDLSTAETEVASQTFEAALEKIKPAAEGMIAKMRTLADPPDEAVVAFGIKLGARTGALIASPDTEANFLVTLKWKGRKQAK